MLPTEKKYRKASSNQFPEDKAYIAIYISIKRFLCYKDFFLCTNHVGWYCTFVLTENAGFLQDMERGGWREKTAE